MPKKDEGKEVLSLRFDPSLLERIDEIVVRYHSLTNVALGFGHWRTAVPSRSEVIRFAIAEGLTVMEEKLAKAEEKKRKAAR
jgi:metal-responsive CopG/Arc/MetJ family transcriptional regulator